MEHLLFHNAHDPILGSNGHYTMWPPSPEAAPSNAANIHTATTVMQLVLLLTKATSLMWPQFLEK